MYTLYVIHIKSTSIHFVNTALYTYLYVRRICIGENLYLRHRAAFHQLLSYIIIVSPRSFRILHCKALRSLSSEFEKTSYYSNVRQSCTIGLSDGVSIHFFSIWTPVHGNPTEALAWPPIEAALELRPSWQAQQTLHFKFRPAAA